MPQPFKRYTKHDYLFLKGKCVQIPPLISVKTPKVYGLPSKSAPSSQTPLVSIGTVNPSLDTKPQISTWTKKAKRVYHCVLSGLKRCEYNKTDAYFITLTSSPGSRDIAKHWDLLVKRIRRELNFKFEYCKVETSEGNGVIHAVCHSCFDGWQYDAIHAYLSCLWQELHGAYIVWVSPVLFAKKVSAYMTQYMSSQVGFIRRSCSLNWIFKGFRSKFIELIKKHGFKTAISLWELLLMEGLKKETLQIPLRENL